MKTRGPFAPTLHRYVLTRILLPLSLALFIVLAALSLERLLRLIDIVAENNAPLSSAASMLLYLQPHYLGLALPAALFISVILAVRLMQESSELVIMQAVGIPYIRLLIPVVALSLIATFIMIILTGYAQPHGRYLQRATLQDVKTTGQTLRLNPGLFYHFDDRATIRVDAVGNRGTLFRGFFAEYYDKDGTRHIITSELADVVDTPDSADASLNLTLTNARIIEREPGKSPRIITTDSYPLAMEIGPAKAYGARGQDKRELTYGELLRGGVTGIMVENTAQELRAEFHFRLVQSLSIPVLAILAIPLGLLGRGRTGTASGLAIGVILLVLYEKTLGFAASFAAKGQISAFIGIWSVWLGLILFTSLFMAAQTGAITAALRKQRSKNEP